MSLISNEEKFRVFSAQTILISSSRFQMEAEAEISMLTQLFTHS